MDYYLPAERNTRKEQDKRKGHLQAMMIQYGQCIDMIQYGQCIDMIHSTDGANETSNR